MGKRNLLFMILVSMVFVCLGMVMVNGAVADDYITIPGANTSLAYTGVYGDYFYVVNDTDIIEYYLENGLETNRYQINPTMSSINQVMRKADQLYIDCTYSAVQYMLCFDLDDFTELNRTLWTNCWTSGENDEIQNIVYIETPDGMGYWVWGRIYTSGMSTIQCHNQLFLVNRGTTSSPDWDIYATGFTYSGTTTSGGRQYIYWYNVTGASSGSLYRSTGTMTARYSYQTYASFSYNVTTHDWETTGGYGQRQMAWNEVNLEDNNDIGNKEDVMNLQHEHGLDWDGDELILFATWFRYGSRDNDVMDNVPDQSPSARNQILFWWDVDGYDQDYVFMYRRYWDTNYPQTFYVAYYDEIYGFSAWSSHVVNHDPKLDRNIYKYGRASFDRYETPTTAYENFIGYVNRSDLSPIAEIMISPSGNDIVSSFDYADVVQDSRIYNGGKNLVACFTMSNDGNLYILRNLIDREHLEDPYITPTIQYHSSTLWNIVNGQRVANDGWLFMGEVYEMEFDVSNVSYFYAQMLDGEHTIRFYYDNSTRAMNVTVDDNNVAGLIASEVVSTNETTRRFTLIWRFILNKQVVDIINTTITYYGINTPEGTTVSGTAFTGLTIYNLGGFVSYTFNGDGGRTTGGDAFELYATNGSLSSSAYAEVIFRKLQHMHLLVEIDMDNDFDTDHLDFPYGCGFVEYGFDYRLGGAWVTGWKCKIYVDLARVGRYGGGYDSSYVRVVVDWYNPEHQAGIIKTDKIYAYHYGYDKDSDYANRKSIILWVDLWFNRMNASTVVGGRVNSYEHGMYEAGSVWWFGYGAFRPKIGNKTASMFFDDLYDGSSDITSCQPIEIVRAWAKVEKINDIDGNDDTWTLKNYEVLNWKLADDRMEGVDTPVFVETKDPSMPKTGFVAPLMKAIQGISTAIWKGVLGAMRIVIGGIDSLLLWMNSPVTMSQMIDWIMIQASYVGTWIMTVIEQTATILTIFTNMITVILQVITYMTSAIAWVLIYVVGFPIHFLNVIIAFFQGGNYTVGEFTFQFDHVGELSQAVLEFAPYTIGFMFVAWYIWGNVDMKGDPDAPGIPSRTVKIFSWFKEVYQSVFWIFNAMQNKIVELYNFIRSHIPGLGGGGGKTSE